MLLVIVAVVGIGGYYFYTKNASSAQTQSGPVVSVTPAPPDPGQLQNISQALGALTNEVNAQPHPVTVQGVSQTSTATK